jgi:D-3-phosphoglycerate dehydrogenase
MKKILISTETFGRCGGEPLQTLIELIDENILLVMNPFGRKLNEDEVIRMGKDCIGIIAGIEPLNARVLRSLPSLRCISRCGVGMENIDMKAAKQLGITVVNTPSPVRAVAELTVAVILDMLRRISFHDRMVRSGNWQVRAGGLLLNKKVGILGLGSIGKEAAMMLQALGAKVAGCDIKPDEEWAEEHWIPLLTFKHLMRDSDIVSVHISYKPKNYHLIGQRELETMKTGAYLVNISRGEVVDEDALYLALAKGHLSGAALDVFSDEPYVGPLSKLDNVILTPHIGSYARESRLEMEKRAVKNLLEGLKK